MKRLSVFLTMVFLLSCILSGCGTTKDAQYTVVKGGTSYVVDPKNSTIFDGTHTYHYVFSGTKSSYRADIIYPDGSSYWFKKEENFGHGGWSNDYREDRYVAGDILCEVLLKNAPKESNPAKYLAAFFMAYLGIFYLVSPHSGWYLAYGWRYKGAEPTDAALMLNRIGGAAAIIAAIILIFV